MSNEPSDAAKAWPDPALKAALDWYADRKSKQFGALIHPNKIKLTGQGSGTAIAMVNAYASGHDAGVAAECERNAKIEAAARELANLSTTHYTMHGIANCRCCMSMNNGIAALLALLEKP